MGKRQEARRLAREQEKDLKKMKKVLKSAGLPDFQMPPAPVRVSGLTDEEVAARTGAKIVALEQWRREQTEEIRKLAILEAQERLDQAEEAAAVVNFLASLEALRGFRYAKAAANYLTEHFTEASQKMTQDNVRQYYDRLHEDFGIEVEFEDLDADKLLGFDTLDWRYEYIRQRMPRAVFDVIYDDAKNLQSVTMQLAIMWEVCEEFRYHKKKGILDKFVSGLKKRFDLIDSREYGIAETIEMLREKYQVDITWGKGIQSTLKRFHLWEETDDNESMA